MTNTDTNTTPANPNPAGYGMAATMKYNELVANGMDPKKAMAQVRDQLASIPGIVWR